MREFSRWLKRRFHSFDYLLEYFDAVRLHFLDVIWGIGVGAGVPYMIFGLYSLFKTPPPVANWIAIVGALFLSGYYLWRADHMRLEKKLEITRLVTQEWKVPQGEVMAGHPARAWWFEVGNLSEGTTIEDVTVQIKTISPEVKNLNWLPIHLHLKHDDPAKAEDYKQSFNLNPGEPKTIDLVSSFEGDNRFSIIHTVPRANRHVQFDTEGHRLEVIVTAKDMPILSVWFKVWRGEDDLIQCERE